MIHSMKHRDNFLFNSPLTDVFVCVYIFFSKTVGITHSIIKEVIVQNRACKVNE